MNPLREHGRANLLHLAGQLGHPPDDFLSELAKRGLDLDDLLEMFDRSAKELARQRPGMSVVPPSDADVAIGGIMGMVTGFIFAVYPDDATAAFEL